MNALLTGLLMLISPALQERVPVQPDAAASANADRVFAIYEIGDILSPQSGPGAEIDLIRMREAQHDEARRLVRTLRSFMTPPFQAGLDELEAPSETNLVALVTPAQQAWIQEVLELQRRSRGTLVNVSTRIVSGPRGSFGRLLGTEHSATTLEDPSELELLLAQLAGSTEFEVLSSPMVLVRARQRASVSTFSEVSYVKEYHLRVIQPSGVELADPVVESIREGVEVKLCATPLEEDLYALEVELELTKLTRPIATRMVRVRAGKESEFEVGMPEVNTVAVSSQLLLADGATAVLLAASPTEDRDLAVLIHMEIAAPGTPVPQAVPAPPAEPAAGRTGG